MNNIPPKIDPDQMQAAQRRVDDASDESRSLALDAIFDFALQEALLSYEQRQFKRQCEGRSKK